VRDVLLAKVTQCRARFLKMEDPEKIGGDKMKQKGGEERRRDRAGEKIVKMIGREAQGHHRDRGRRCA
jgi:hypothetical protein